MIRDAAPRPTDRVTARPRRRYHFHFPGVMYVAVTLFLALGAINSQNNLLFLALGLAIGGLLVSGILSGASLMGLRLERVPALRATVGRPVAIRYAVTNRNRLFPAFGLTIAELPTASSRREPTWMRHIPGPNAFATGVAAGATSSAEAIVSPTARGRADFVLARISTTFPFGLARKSVTFELPQALIVLPAELPLRPGVVENLTARSPYGVGGERSPGMGDEFFGLREYVPGDSPRRIAWRRTARTGELIVRQNTTPSPLRLWVVLHGPAGPAPRPPSRNASGGVSPAALFERAVALSAAVIRNAADEDIAVGLAVPDARILEPPRLGRVHLDRLLSELALLDVEALGRAEPVGFPDPVARSGACVVIHAGPVDRLYGPRHAHHLAAADLPRLIESSASASHLLSLIDAVAAPSPARRGLWRSQAQSAA